MLDRFTCEDLFRRLDDYLDRELSGEEGERIREHLEACAQCAMEYEFEGQLLTALKEKLRRIAAPPDLLARISRSLRQDGKS